MITALSVICSQQGAMSTVKVQGWGAGGASRQKQELKTYLDSCMCVCIVPCFVKICD